jgi:hypothetical protein
MGFEDREGKKEYVLTVRLTAERNWCDDPRKREKIAFEIYRKVMLDKDISKAITAQVAARKLLKWKQRKKLLATAILESEHLKYIVDAICHVTRPRDSEGEDVMTIKSEFWTSFSTAKLLFFNALVTLINR